MDILRVPLAAIPDRGYEVDATVPVKALQPEDAAPLPLENVLARGTMTRIGHEYLFRGYLQGVFAHPCDRCLEEARAPFEVEVGWLFEEGVAPAKSTDVPAGEEIIDGEVDLSDGPHLFQGTEIDLGPFIWEEVSLAAPLKYVCSVECKGLCPRCGANLNTAPCGCAVEESGEFSANQGLAGLADMFPDLPRKQSEE